jgi:hypothetical protein
MYMSRVAVNCHLIMAADGWYVLVFAGWDGLGES